MSDKWPKPSTSRQVRYIHYLATDAQKKELLGIYPIRDIDDLTRSEASEVIEQLKRGKLDRY